MSQNSPREWLGTKAAAEHLGVAQSTLWRLVDEGKVRCYRPARHFQFLREDLDTFLESTRVKPGTVSSKRSDVAARRRQANKPPAGGP